MPETVRQYLAATAQRELDALRAELDVRLSALEAALTSPDPHASLENLVLNLARVVAAEAESTTARAALQAQLHAQDRAAAATAQVQRMLDAERAITQAVRLELEQARTAFDAERSAMARLRVEFDDLKKALEKERQAGVASGRQVQELEQALKNERARTAAIESDTDILRLEVEEAGTLLEAERVSAARVRSEFDQVRKSLEEERRAGGASGRQVQELEHTLRNERARTAALESDIQNLRLELEQAGKTLVDERETSEMLRLESEDIRKSLEDVRKSLEEERLAGVASRGQMQELEHTLQNERARTAALDSDTQTLRFQLDEAGKSLEGERETAELLRLELDDSRKSLEEERLAGVAFRGQVQELEHALENERARAVALDSDTQALRHQLGEAGKALEDERETAELLRLESDDVRKSLEEAHAAAVATSRQIQELEQALQAEQAGKAALEYELGEQRDGATHQSKTLKALQSDLAAAKRAVEARAVDDDSHRVSMEALERRYAELDRQHDEATARIAEMAGEADALRAALDAERQQAVAAQAAAEMRAAAFDADHANAERARIEAQARAEETIAERDDLAARLDAAEAMNQGIREAIEGRLTAIDEVYKRTVKAREEAEARADAAILERDALAAELAGGRPAAVPDAEIAERLEAAIERIRVLELDLFERDRGPRDRDVDLVPLLDTTASPPSEHAGKSAKRYAFPAGTNIRIDREGGLLVDLSVTGAQVICKTSPEVGRIVTLTLLSDEAPCFGEGRLLWARREQTAKGRPFRYRVGLVFTAVNEAEIEAYIKEHSTG